MIKITRLLTTELNSLTHVRTYWKVTHCLFDLDGTLLDSEILFHQMMKDICGKYGKNYTKEMENRMYGQTDKAISTAVVKELKLPMPVSEFESLIMNLSSKTLPFARLKEGVERLLTHLHANQIPIALATNSTQRDVRLHSTAKPHIFGLFHHKVTVTDTDVARGKPYPDIYLVAAARFPDKPKPKQCLVFEDSKVGVEAARAAGMQVVMIPGPRLDRCQTSHATIVLNSLLDFKPELFGLPPFGSTKGRSGPNKMAKIADKGTRQDKGN